MFKMINTAWAWLVAKMQALWQKVVVVAMYIFASSIFAIQKVFAFNIWAKLGIAAIGATVAAFVGASFGTIAWAGIPMSIFVDTLILTAIFDVAHYLYAFTKQMMSKQGWKDAFYEANRQRRVNGMHDVNKRATA